MRAIWTLALVLGCADKSTGSGEKGGEEGGGDDSGAADDSGATDEPLTQEELYALWVNVSTEAVGDSACWTGDWIVEAADPACVEVVPAGGMVEDFAFGAAMAGAEVALYYEDTTFADADATTTTSNAGEWASSLPTCTPYAYRVSSVGLVDTYQFHSSHGPEKTIDTDLLAVTSDTWTTLPAFAGLTADDTLGVAAGAAEDCNGDVLENAQVILRDANGQIPQDMYVAYTYDGLPNRGYTATTSDGYWIAMNVPEGVYTAEMYIYDGAGSQVLVGQAPVEVYTYSVTISNVRIAREQGWDLDDACLDCSGEEDTGDAGTTKGG